MIQKYFYRLFYCYIAFKLFLLTNIVHAQEIQQAYLIKHNSQNGIAEQLKSISGVNYLELDTIMTAKGFLLLEVSDVEHLLKTEAVLYMSPVFSASKNQYITFSNELFVAFHKPVSKGSISYIEEKYKIRLDAKFNALPDVYKFKISEKNTSKLFELSQLISSEKSVRYCQPNYMFTPSVSSNDPFFFRQWALQNTGIPQQFNGTPGADMKVTEAWEISRGSALIRVAILDSGVDTLHPDLLGNLLPGFDATEQGTNGHPGMNYSSDAHGTACAGIVAAVADNGIGIAGVAPLCKIVPVRLFHYINFMGQIIPWSTSEWMVNGITWAWQEGKADVMSNSWGITDQFLSMFPGQDSIVNQAIYLALSQGRNGKGVPMLFSSGNDGDAPIWPSRIPEVIAVNATSMCDERKNPTSCDNESFWEGNWGEDLDIAAPGVKIYTTDISGPFGYSNGDYTATFNGTSAACPNAAGVMALILSVNPNLNVQQARYILESTCDKVGGYDYDTQKSSGSWSQELGYGRVNALNALIKAQSFLQVNVENSFYVYADNATNKSVVVCKLDNMSEITLEIFDLKGRSIAVYNIGKRDKGVHYFYINENLKQGLYFARLVLDGQSSTVKFFAQ